MIDLDEFYNDMMQTIHASAEGSQDFSEVIFTEHVCDFLVEQAVLEDYASVGFRKTGKALRADAWHYSAETGTLYLMVTDFRFEPKIQSLTASDVKAGFKRVQNFFSECLKNKFYQALEESASVYEVARSVFEAANEIRQVQFILLSNASLSKRVKSLERQTRDGRTFSFDVWDTSRLHRIVSSGKAREDIQIDFTEYADEGIPCLNAFGGSKDYRSFLLVMPGPLVARLYGKYGERLLEQNVRTFLQFRGKVNKGIRNTIANEPEMFFAFNNGLSATAEHVIIDAESGHLRSVTNLQIVNGGQTTASLFTAWRKSQIDLSDVYVQVKLSVIPSEKVESVVPKISEFANTQNKVNAADFFANHPFHLRIEEISRRLWAPSTSGDLRETHWFYERARGQYSNAQAHLSSAGKIEFLALNPRSQMFTKTDLAKFQNTFDKLPHIVSRGAQKNFAEFASKVGSRWDAQEKQFNELYFRHLIAKAILFRYLDRMILKQPWYGGGYKANIVTYTLAKFAHMAEQLNRVPDYETIWKKQQPSFALEGELLRLAEVVNDELQRTPPSVRNVTEYCKKEFCWERVRGLNLPLSAEVIAELVNPRSFDALKREAVSTQRQDNAIQAEVAVVEKGAQHWLRLREWIKKHPVLSPKELGVLNIACDIPRKIPSEKQAAILIEAEARAIQEGFPP